MMTVKFGNDPPQMNGNVLIYCMRTLMSTLGRQISKNFLYQIEISNIENFGIMTEKILVNVYRDIGWKNS